MFSNMINLSNKISAKMNIYKKEIPLKNRNETNDYEYSY